MHRWTDSTGTGTAFLTTAIGPSATAAELVTAPVNFTAPQLSNYFDTDGQLMTPLFTGLDPGPGTYYLTIVESDANLGAFDSFIWLGDNRSPTIAPGSNARRLRLLLPVSAVRSLGIAQ